MKDFHFKKVNRLGQEEPEEELEVKNAEEEEKAKKAKEAKEAEEQEDEEQKDKEEEEEDVDYEDLYKKEQSRSEKLTEELNESLEKKEEDLEPPELDSVDFISSREDFDGIMSEHERMNEVLQDVRQNTYEGILKVLPRVIDNMVDQKLAIRSLVSTFYQDNKDLVGVKNYVQEVVADLLPKYGNSLSKVVPVLAEEVRKRLDIKKPEVKKEKKLDPPAKPKIGLSTPTISNPGVTSEEESAFSKDWADFQKGA